MVVAVGAASVVVFAFSASGYRSQNVALNDGGIWVTSNQYVLFGQLNKPAGSLSGALNPLDEQNSTINLDIRQDGAAVVGWDRAASTIYPVDVNGLKAVKSQEVHLAPDAQVELNGGTLAVLDPASGQVWAQRVDNTVGISDLSGLDPASNAKPVASLGAPQPKSNPTDSAALTVTANGTVFAVSNNGRLDEIPAKTAGFGTPLKQQLGQLVKQIQLTAVGEEPVVLEVDSGVLLLPGGKQDQVVPTDPTAQLQQPSAGGDSVAVATSTELLTVPLAGGSSNVVFKDANGKPATPAWLGDHLHGAWAGGPHQYEVSVGGAPATADTVKNLSALIEPEFRINRNQIVLNDLGNGAVYDLDTGRKVDDWPAVAPPKTDTTKTKSKDNNQPSVSRDVRPPKAASADLGVRAGRTAVLHLLDYTSDPAGYVLSLDSPISPDRGTATVAPDGQTVNFTMPASGGDAQFTYSVNDGHGHRSNTATITVHTHDSTTDIAPSYLAGVPAPALHVAAGASFIVPVLSNWRDGDSDALVLKKASVAANQGTVTTTPDGQIRYTAPALGPAQTVNITYVVSDGRQDSLPASQPVIVLAPGSVTGAAPIAEPDVVRGQVGEPIVVHPLDNDLPGADPTNPAATLALDGQVLPVSGTTVTTDIVGGTVTVTATAPQTYWLSYSAAFGIAPRASAQIRVDVVPRPATPLPPVTVPDAAVIYGQVPATVDVTANDYDPAGGVLTVQSATTTAPLHVTVVQGHFLRISPTSSTPSTAQLSIQYTVTDGTGTASGEVGVTELPAITPDTPVTQNDYATVRQGDVVTVAVLANDTTPGGDPLTLDPIVSDAPAGLPVGQLPATLSGTSTPAGGQAYVDGNSVRYVAPVTVTSPQTVDIEYVAQDVDGTSRGDLIVTVNPKIGPANPNQPPNPQAIEARVVAGDVITLAVPTSQIDPDGDSVTVTGIGSAPTLGRITAIGANYLKYEAFPTDTGGTDTFDYQVQDRFGKPGQAQIRIGVSAPAASQSLVAVADNVTAKPGATLDVNVTANDIYPPGDVVTVALKGPSHGAKVLPGGTTLQVSAPSDPRQPLVVSYVLTDGSNQSPVADLTVHAQAGYKNPPTARDTFAKADANGTSASVNVHNSASAADGSAVIVSGLQDAPAGATSAPTGAIKIPMGPAAQLVVYEVRDSQGSTAIGLIYVPAVGAGVPYAKGTIQIPQGTPTLVDITKYVVDPTPHRQLRLTVARFLSAAPTSGLRAALTGLTTIRLTPAARYAGPAALTFQVTDGATLNDPSAVTAMVTIPVQVGASTPILRCPTAPLQVYQGGPELTFDVTSQCHVWVADRSELPGLTYNAGWKGAAPAGVTLSGSGQHQLQLSADTGSHPGSTGVITVASGRSPAVSVNVQVLASPPPTVSPVVLNGVKAGQIYSVEMATYITSQERNPVNSVVSAVHASGPAATVSHSGGTVSITPGPTVNGTITVAVVISDVKDPSETDQQAGGVITLHVLGPPTAPGAPVPGLSQQSSLVNLKWTAPADSGGSPIDHYVVSWSGGSQQCSLTTCAIGNLKNGNSYTFSVTAFNAAGFSSPPSGGSVPATPDQVPGIVTGVVAKALGGDTSATSSVTVTWVAPTGPGSNIEGYQLVGGPAPLTLPASARQATIPSLTNGSQYSFKIRARNSAKNNGGYGAFGVSNSVIPYGTPARMAAPSATGDSSAIPAESAITVSWTKADGNGVGIGNYVVTEYADGVAQTPLKVNGDRLQQSFTVSNAGTEYTYTIAAVNSQNLASQPSAASGQVSAVGKPGKVTNQTAVATGTDGTMSVTFDLGVANGARIDRVQYVVSGGPSGSWPIAAPGSAGTPVTQTIGGLNNGQSYSVTLTEFNVDNKGTESSTPSDTVTTATVIPYGPITGLAATTSALGPNVTWTVTVNPNGRPVNVLVTNNHGYSNTFATGDTTFSTSGTDNVGFNNSDAISVTVSDGLRPTQSTSSSIGTASPPALTVTEGGYNSSATSYCAANHCRQIDISVQNFEPNSSFTLYYDTDCAGVNAAQCSGGNNAGETHYKSETITTDGAGNASVGDRYFGYWGSHVWVDAVAFGNTVTAPQVVFVQ